MEILTIIEEHAHHFLTGVKTEYAGEKEAVVIIRKYVGGGKITDEEYHVLKTQLADSLKIVGIGVPFALIPGASIVMPILIKVAEKHNIELMPSAFVNRDHPAFKEEAEPFYAIIMKGLEGEVDGEHFWDAVAEDAVFEFLYRFPGFPEKIKGRKAYMEWFGGYSMKLQTADGLVVHKSTEPGVIILEYAVHGMTPANKPYNNRFCSIITIRDRKIVHWRDYMDSLAVTTALS